MIMVSGNDREGIISDLVPDLTPLLDVMFMLIVFLILTANAVPFALDVNLPADSEQVTHAVEDPNQIVVTLLPQGQGWKLGDVAYAQEVDMKNALLKAHQADDKKDVVIVGDKLAPMDKLMQLLVFLRAQNITAADIVMERP